MRQTTEHPLKGNGHGWFRYRQSLLVLAQRTLLLHAAAVLFFAVVNSEGIARGAMLSSLAHAGSSTGWLLNYIALPIGSVGLLSASFGLYLRSTTVADSVSDA